MNHRAIGTLLAAWMLMGCDTASPPSLAHTPQRREPQKQAAEPPPAHPNTPAHHARLSQAQRLQIASLLARGRVAARGGNRPEALALFRQGLALDPNRPALLCEAGWAAFHLDDPQAREYLESGARLMNVPERRAACLYNLGRWHERRAEQDAAGRDRYRAAAIRAYGDSLSLRPNNQETQQRYRALAGSDDDPEHACPPGQRFASIAQLCAALLPLNYSEPGERAACGATPAGWEPIAIHPESTGPGTLLAIADEAEYSGGWTIWYLVHQVRGGFDILGVLGNQWDRDCSGGDIEVSHARWVAQASGSPLLVVELHETGADGCAPSAWETCIEDAEAAGRDPDSCDHADDEPSEEETDERYRMICAERSGRYRCSRAKDVHGIRPSARIGRLPEGAALDAMLECPL